MFEVFGIGLIVAVAPQFPLSESGVLYCNSLAPVIVKTGESDVNAFPLTGTVIEVDPVPSPLAVMFVRV